MITLSAAGEAFLTRVGHGVKSVYIAFLLLIMGLLYVPITKQAFSVWVYFGKSCAVGSWYPVASPSTSLSSIFSSQIKPDLDSLDQLTGTKGECESCTFLSGPAADSSCPFTTELCPATSSLRLRASPNLNC